MKSLLKAALPEPWLARLRRYRRGAAWQQFHREWRMAIGKLPSRSPSPLPRSLLLFPADPGHVTGSLGDDGMITATIDHFRAVNPDLRISMFCAAGPSEDIARGEGFAPLVLPAFRHFPAEMAAILDAGDYDGLMIFGADVMDGYYSPEYSAMLLAAADLAARAGMRSQILGFSFNAAAAPELAPCFAKLDPRVELNLRDSTSMERIGRLAPVRARLVADTAFALSPGGIDAETEDWIGAERAAGRTVIGVNLHPMLIRDASAGQIERMVGQMAGAIAAASVTADIAWLLVPHDYRDAAGAGDGICLRPLQSRLQAMPDIRSRYFEGVHRAATLKALAGRLDGVVTGRMHLAIAALGMGVPVLCVTYQDKFEGLFRHFGLPQELLLSPATFETDGALSSAVERFLARLPELRATIAQRRDHVLGLARKNFRAFEEDAA